MSNAGINVQGMKLHVIRSMQDHLRRTGDKEIVAYLKILFRYFLGRLNK
jgi:hypothetical protein